MKKIKTEDEFCILASENINKEQIENYGKNNMCRITTFANIMYQYSSFKNFPIHEASYKAVVSLPMEQQLKIIPKLHPQLLHAFRKGVKQLPNYMVEALTFEQITGVLYFVVIGTLDEPMLTMLENKYKDRLDEPTYTEFQACYYKKYLLEQGYDDSYRFDEQGRTKIWLVRGENYTLREMIEKRKRILKFNESRIKTDGKYDVNSEYYDTHEYIRARYLLFYFGFSEVSKLIPAIDEELNVRKYEDKTNARGSERKKPITYYDRRDFLNKLPNLYKGMVEINGTMMEVTQPIKFEKFPKLIRERDIGKIYNINVSDINTALKYARKAGNLKYIKFNNIDAYIYLEEDIIEFLKEKLLYYII